MTFNLFFRLESMNRGWSVKNTLLTNTGVSLQVIITNKLYLTVSNLFRDVFF